MEDSNDKLFGVLAYFGLLVLVPIFAGKTQFARYHANQGLVLILAQLIVGVAAGIIIGILTLISPVVGLIIGFLFGGAIELVAFIFLILGIVHVANEEMKPLPIIGGITILK